jgi:DNA-binding SARP family transcriptional activator
VDFAVLGPLEVRSDSGPILVSRGRPRRLLIALLLRPRRVVPGDVLVDQVWGDRPPTDAANALHGQVSYLRRVLGLAADGVAPALRTVAGGYVLDLADELLDVRRFERLVASATERLANGTADDVEAALGELRAAIGLWRGEPLQDVIYEQFAEVEIGRLSELRAVAVEHEIHARLLLGRHEEAVPALIGEYPMRERDDDAEIANNLPWSPTALIGRDSELRRTSRVPASAAGAPADLADVTRLAGDHRRRLVRRRQADD